MVDKEKDPGRDFPDPEEQILSEGQETVGEETLAEPEEDELARVKSRLAYLAAEFDNYRKRVAREQEAIVSFGNERILQTILPLLDNLERAISQSQAAGSAEVLLAGVKMIYDQALSELKKFGLEQITAVGDMFDPNRHEAVARVPWEGKPDGTILAESRKGYLLNGRLLRPAQVTVSHGAPGDESPGREEGDGEGRVRQEGVDGEA